MKAQRFCDHCEIVLDLHPSGVQTDDPFECEVAASRELRVLVGGHPMSAVRGYAEIGADVNLIAHLAPADVQATIREAAALLAAVAAALPTGVTVEQVVAENAKLHLHWTVANDELDAIHALLLSILPTCPRCEETREVLLDEPRHHPDCDCTWDQTPCVQTFGPCPDCPEMPGKVTVAQLAATYKAVHGDEFIWPEVAMPSIAALRSVRPSPSSKEGT